MEIIMKKMNIILLSLVVLSSAIFGNSSNETDQKLSVSVGCLTTSGDLSEYNESAMSIDFLINCNKSCSVFGKELNLGLGIGLMPLSYDEEEDSNGDVLQKLSFNSIALHAMPNFNLPVSFGFAAGLSQSIENDEYPKQGVTGFVSMDIFYKLPFCENVSLGFQYRQFVPTDLGTYGLALKIDG